MTSSVLALSGQFQFLLSSGQPRHWPYVHFGGREKHSEQNWVYKCKLIELLGDPSTLPVRQINHNPSDVHSSILTQEILLLIMLRAMNYIQG